MINKHSIFFNITAIFAISLFLVFVSFFMMHKQNVRARENFILKRHIDIAKIALHPQINKHIFAHNTRKLEDFENSLKNINFIIIKNINNKNEILNNKNAVTLYTQYMKYGEIKYFKLKDKYYIYMKKPNRDMLLLDNSVRGKNKRPFVLSAFILIFFTFIFLYITIIRKLLPIKILQNKIKNLAEEDFDTHCPIDKKDEISQLANEFDKTVKKLKNLKESRNIFIRNIMHELKTPITKGRFLLQLPQNEENIDKMQKVFYRLESLINEFATIEELMSTKKMQKKKEYYLEDVIDNSADILMCNKSEVVCDFENIKLNINFQLFCIAIKNLLDNGIKYSNNNQVVIKTQNNKIIFQNTGDKLKYPLERYFEAFFKGDDVKSNQSFGLGLYIVKNILDEHSCKIQYSYEDGVNWFMLEPL